MKTLSAPIRTEQLTITFPKLKSKYKKELMRQKKEEHLNISSYIVELVEKDLGYGF
tara:strand:+ start:278 stop:445 length:168 start_codon:yes stop_codon:yes gene_type:complete